MLCRNTEKAEEAATEIRKDTGNQVDVHKLDLSSLKSVRECAQILLDKEDKIDLLINNAGIHFCIIYTIYNFDMFEIRYWILMKIFLNNRHHDMSGMEDGRWI